MATNAAGPATAAARRNHSPSGSRRGAAARRAPTPPSAEQPEPDRHHELEREVHQHDVRPVGRRHLLQPGTTAPVLPYASHERPPGISSAEDRRPRARAAGCRRCAGARPPAYPIALPSQRVSRAAGRPRASPPGPRRRSAPAPARARARGRPPARVGGTRRAGPSACRRRTRTRRPGPSPCTRRPACAWSSPASTGSTSRGSAARRRPGRRPTVSKPTGDCIHAFAVTTNHALAAPGSRRASRTASAPTATAGPSRTGRCRGRSPR